MDIRPMDWVRGVLANALVEDMDVRDLMAMAEHARTCEEWDNAVNELAQTMDSSLSFVLVYPK